MANRTQTLLHRWLPFVAAGAAVVFLLSVSVVDTYVESQKRREDEAFRAKATEAQVAQEPETSPDMLPALVVADARAVLDRAARAAISLDGSPWVVEEIARIVAENDTIQRLWVVNDRGSIVYFGKERPDQTSVEKLAPEEVHRLLQGLPQGLLQPEQRLAILTLAAVQDENQRGKRNQIHSEVRRIQGGWLAVAAQNPHAQLHPSYRQYGYSDSTRRFLHWQSMAIGFSLLLYWLSLPGWVALDALKRQERAALWGIFTLIGNLIGLLVYMLARKED